jgi:hypothetical protein
MAKPASAGERTVEENMPEPMIRGHVIEHTAKFFRVECEPALALRIDSALPLELRVALREISSAGWYPRRYEVALLQAVAEAHGDEAGTRRDLLRCGASMAVGGNEFMKLLMKVLTPELFLKKAPRFWTRDHQDDAGYQLDRIDPVGRTASLRLRGVSGYTHSGLVWLGWIQGVFAEMCQAGWEINQQGWTWSNPAPDEIVYEVKWS